MKINKILLTLNIVLVTFIIAFFSLSFKDDYLFKTIEAQKLVIRAPGEKTSITLQIDKKTPSITVCNESGSKQIEMLGGDNPEISLFSKHEKKIANLKENSGSAELILYEGDKPKMHLSTTAILLKNDQNKVISSFTTLSDGGGGFGLADKDGMASTILRGGDNPSLSMFGDRAEPISSFGVAANVPHFMISAEKGNEGILLHGGQRSGMMVLDEAGQLKIFICKDGIYQGKSEAKVPEAEKKPKLFTHKEDQKILFPDQKKSVR